MAVSDTAFTYLAHRGGYSSGDLIDAGWFAAYLAIGAAALVYESPVDAARSRTVPSPMMSVLTANVPILVALSVIAVEVSRGADLDRVEWGIALCLTVVVLTRLLLDLLERKGCVPSASSAVVASCTVGSSPSRFPFDGFRTKAPCRPTQGRSCSCLPCR
jgi:hypothetical protein